MKFGALSLVTAFILSTAYAATECEVCIKVIEDVRASMEKSDRTKKDKIEKALGAYCDTEKNKLGPRERKICYYIDPIKRDVSQPFSTGMPASKVCSRINKSNPEICTVKFPVKTANLEAKDFSKMRVKQLKSILADRGVECKNCLEKAEFVKRVEETMHLDGSDEF